MKKFSRTGILLVGSMLVCVILALAVGIPNGFFGDGGKSGDLDDEGTPGFRDVVKGSTPIFVFDQSAEAKALVAAFDKGKIDSVTILYDSTGKGRARTTCDQDEIREIYKAIKNIVITGEDEADSTADTGNEHYVSFEFNDGETCRYDFSNDDQLQYNGGTYPIAGGDDLWEILRDSGNSKNR